MLKPAPDTKWLTVVGVVKEVQFDGLATDRKLVGACYYPFAQAPEHGMSLMVKSTIESNALVGSIRKSVATIDPALPFYAVHTMTHYVDQALMSRRVPMLIAGAFAAVALLLSAIGIYGVLAYGVAQRRREIGIRLALGSTGAEVFALVLREGVKIVTIGLALGFAGLLALRHVLTAVLYGVTPLDPFVIGRCRDRARDRRVRRDEHSGAPRLTRESRRRANGLTLLDLHRDERIDAHRPSRGHVARDRRDDDQQQRGQGVARRIGRRHVEEQRPHEARERQRARDADRDADEHELHAAADDHAQHVAGLGADRHAQPNLARALAHRVGHDAVEADRGEEQRDAGEEHQEQHREAPLRDRVADDRRERRDRIRRQSLIEVAHGLTRPAPASCAGSPAFTRASTHIVLKSSCAIGTYIVGSAVESSPS